MTSEEHQDLAAISRIHDLSRTGRISPSDAALLIELRHEIKPRRRWWYRAVRWLQRWA